MHLPEKFQKEMEILLGDEYQAFKESYDRQPENGLRLNRKKGDGRGVPDPYTFLVEKNTLDRQRIYVRDRYTGERSVLLCGIVLSAGTECNDTCQPSVAGTG